MEVEKNLRLPFFFCACHLVRPKKEISQRFLKILEMPPNMEVGKNGRELFFFSQLPLIFFPPKNGREL